MMAIYTIEIFVNAKPISIQLITNLNKFV